MTKADLLNYQLRVDAAGSELVRCGALDFAVPGGLVFVLLADRLQRGKVEQLGRDLVEAVERLNSP